VPVRTSADTENPELHVCLAMAQQVTCLSLWRPRFNFRPLDVEFVVDKVTLGQVFSEHVTFPLQVQGGSNMTGTDLCVNKPHCAAAVRP